MRFGAPVPGRPWLAGIGAGLGRSPDATVYETLMLRLWSRSMLALALRDRYFVMTNSWVVPVVRRVRGPSAVWQRRAAS